VTLRGDNLTAQFIALLDDYVRTRYGNTQAERKPERR